jgi:hypothetical protein
METIRETPYYKEIHLTRKGRVSWAAIFGGTLIMLITLMLLSLLGIGIGIASINPMEESRPLQGLGTGALVWWVISNLLAVFAGAYTAAKLTNVYYSYSGMLHGILSWSLYTLISVVIMTSSVAGIISGVGGVVSKSLSAVGMGLSELPALTEQADNDRINRLIQDALSRNEEPGTVNEGQQFDIDFMLVAQDVFIQDGEFATNVQRNEVEQAIAQNSTLSQQDVERAADVLMREYERLAQRFERLKQKAEEDGQQIAEAASSAAIWSFVALLFGLIAAGLGGYLGKPNLIDEYDTTVNPRV